MKTDSTKIRELREALEKATGPDRELSNEVLFACGWRMDEDGGGPDRAVFWIAPNGEEFLDGDQPDPTASIDAAMTLVPEGFNWGVGSTGRTGFSADLQPLDLGKGGNRASGSTPAIALCIASLRARAALEDTE